MNNAKIRRRKKQPAHSRIVAYPLNYITFLLELHEWEYLFVVNVFYVFDFLLQCCNILWKWLHVCLFLTLPSTLPCVWVYYIEHAGYGFVNHTTVFIWKYYWLIKMKCHKIRDEHRWEKCILSKSKFWLSLYKILTDWLSMCAVCVCVAMYTFDDRTSYTII